MLALFLLLISAITVGAQNANTAEIPTNVREGANTTAAVNPALSPDRAEYPKPPTVSGKFGYLSTHEFIITLMITILTLIALAMQFFLLKKTPRLKAEETLRVFGVTLIIFGTLFLITAGFNATQIAPGMGLFGTVAGYLLGKSNNKREQDDDK